MFPFFDSELFLFVQFENTIHRKYIKVNHKAKNLRQYRKMNIIFNSEIWQSPEKNTIPDVKTVFAPVNSIRLWLRDEMNAGVHGHAAVHDFYCLYLCLEGRGGIEIDGVPHFLETNEALGVLPRRPHVRLRSTEKVKYLLIRFLTSEPEFIRQLFSGILQYDESLVPLIQKIVTTYEEILRESSVQNQNELGLHLALLLNKLSGKNNCRLSEQVADKRVQEALALIIAPENLNLSIQDIAFKMGITPGHLSDLIHDNLGYPPREVRRSVRHQAAMNYLLHSSLSISEIAEATGFRSVYAFSRFFKNANGESPLAFRRKHKKNQSDD